MSSFLLAFIRSETRADSPIRALLVRWAAAWLTLGLVFGALMSLLGNEVSDVMLAIIGLPVLDLIILLVARVGVRRLDRRIARRTQLGSK